MVRMWCSRRPPVLRLVGLVIQDLVFFIDTAEDHPTISERLFRHFAPTTITFNVDLAAGRQGLPFVRTWTLLFPPWVSPPIMRIVFHPCAEMSEEMVHLTRMALANLFERLLRGSSRHRIIIVGLDQLDHILPVPQERITAAIWQRWLTSQYSRSMRAFFTETSFEAVRDSDGRWDNVELWSWDWFKSTAGEQRVSLLTDPEYHL
jgi:hypothetical protein